MVDPLRIVAAGEAATGLALTLLPGPVASLLFRLDATGSGLAMARIAGLALVALGIACWPGPNTGGGDRGRTALLVYGSLAAIYLSGLGIGGELRGPLLWPAVVVHVGTSAWLARPRAARTGQNHGEVTKRS